MPLWGTSDAASNSTLFALDQLNTTPNTANRTALFGNTTADAFVTGLTVGQFGSDKNEVQTDRLNGGPVRSPGWNLRITKGSRVMNETLVAMSHRSLITDASDDTTLPDFDLLTITTQPESTSVNATANEEAVLTIAGVSTPPGATLVYTWQANTGSGFSTFANGALGSGTVSGQGTSAITVTPTVTEDGFEFRCIISVASSGVANVTSDVATLTVTS
jgi:hypothetical protein